VDGRIGAIAEARVPLVDRGFLHGEGVFETMRAHGGTVFRLDDHATRLRDGLLVLGLHEDLEESFRAAVTALVTAGAGAGWDPLYLRVNVTGGPTEDVAGPAETPAVTGIVRPFKPYPMAYYAHGVKCLLIGHKHRAELTAGVKTLSFAPYVTARRRALAAGAHDAILRNDAGRVAEATTSNVFAFVDDVVHAPGRGEGALAGVTRKVILELIEDTGLAVSKTLPLDLLERADEVWLSNTTGGVVPVTRVDDGPVGTGQKGPLATRLGHAYEDLVRSP
jgi:branched-subunit amino acid aminotransferase/4-amino-4-deoxychorismate lyase